MLDTINMFLIIKLEFNSHVTKFTGNRIWLKSRFNRVKSSLVFLKVSILCEFITTVFTYESSFKYEYRQKDNFDNLSRTSSPCLQTGRSLSI